MTKKKAGVDYADLIARAVEEEKAAVMDGETMLPFYPNLQKICCHPPQTGVSICARRKTGKQKREDQRARRIRK